MDHVAGGDYFKVLGILLEHGSDSNSGNILLIALSDGYSPIVERLLSTGAEAGEDKAMHPAAKCSYEDIVNLLL